ncbi:restriction endonuclease subunit S [Clostridium perfringens]|uniref:restriction endonuclease subunit S n=1 Tax=Clostridium perfringens TaxID=1502 RepID=UPI00375465F7
MEKEVREGYKMTELGEIPNEWQIKNLEDISYLIDGDRSSRYPGEKDIVEHGILFLSTQNIINSKIVYKNCKFITEEKFDELSKGKLQKNDLIITLRGSIGNVAKFNGDIYDTGFINAQIMIIRSNDINPTYLSKYLISVKSQKQITSISSGSAQPQLTKSELKKLKVIVPSEYEQKKIAEILSTVDEQIENTEKLIQKNQELKKGLMQQLLTKGIGHTEFKKTELGEIPKEWKVQKFKDISKVSQGLQIAIEERFREFKQGRLPYITIQYINDKSNSDNEYFIENYNENVVCYESDILMTRTGNTGIVITNEYGVFHNNFFKVDFDKTKLNKDFLVYYLNTPFIQNLIIRYAGTTTIPDLKHSDFYKLPVLVPKIEEQKKIALILSSIDKRIEQYKDKKEKLEEVKRGLMQDLLLGKIRVI